MASIAQPQAPPIGRANGPVRGLTEQEARARRRRGDGNDTGGAPGRSYWDIARANLFSFFNNILFAIGVALIALGRYNDAKSSRATIRKRSRRWRDRRAFRATSRWFPARSWKR